MLFKTRFFRIFCRKIIDNNISLWVFYAWNITPLLKDISISMAMHDPIRNFIFFIFLINTFFLFYKKRYDFEIQKNHIFLCFFSFYYVIRSLIDFYVPSNSTFYMEFKRYISFFFCFLGLYQKKQSDLQFCLCAAFISGVLSCYALIKALGLDFFNTVLNYKDLSILYPGIGESCYMVTSLSIAFASIIAISYYPFFLIKISRYIYFKKNIIIVSIVYFIFCFFIPLMLLRKLACIGVFLSLLITSIFQLNNINIKKNIIRAIICFLFIMVLIATFSGKSLLMVRIQQKIIDIINMNDMRIYLWIQSFKILNSDIKVLLFGGGHAFLEKACVFPAGFYSHNFILSCLVEYGIFSFFSIAFFILINFYRTWKERIFIFESFPCRAMFFISFFCFLITMTSGSTCYIFLCIFHLNMLTSCVNYHKRLIT